MKPLWNPAYAALVARRNASIKSIGKAKLVAAHRRRQALSALCDCDGETTNPADHREWCAYGTSRPAATYDIEAQRAMAAVIEDLTRKGPKR